MLRKLFGWIVLAAALLGTSAFTTQTQPAASNLAGWKALSIAVVLTVMIGILLILQSRNTPENTARYHLDHATHEQDEEEHAEAAPASKVVEITAATEADDLTKIEGIGPKISEILNAAGFTRFDELARADVENLKGILREAGPRYALADPSSWPEQAGYLANGDLEKLKMLTESLRGGRKVA